MMACTIWAAGVKPGESERRGGRGLVERMWMCCAALARIMWSSVVIFVLGGGWSVIVGSCLSEACGWSKVMFAMN